MIKEKEIEPGKVSCILFLLADRESRISLPSVCRLNSLASPKSFQLCGSLKETVSSLPTFPRYGPTPTFKGNLTSITISLQSSQSPPFSSNTRQIIESTSLKAYKHSPAPSLKNLERRSPFPLIRLAVHSQFLRTIILLLRKLENGTLLQIQHNNTSNNPLILIEQFYQSMNMGAGDYYSVSNKGYTKHPNVEIIGIENYPQTAKSLPMSTPTTDPEFQDKSIIKEEELEYDLPEARIVQQMPRIQSYNQARKIMQKEEVNSVHLTTPKCSNEPQNLTHSCIANGQTTQYKGILKRSLHQLHKKNINSQEDINSDKDLYLELEKERRLRRELEKSYKGLLSQMQRKERTYSVQLNGQEREDDGRKRQFSKRTLNEEKNSEGAISYEELASAKTKKISDFKTVKLKQPQKCKEIQSQEEKQEDNNQQQCQSQDSNDYRKEAMTQQSAQEESDYFKDQREFQHRVISQMRDLNKRITQIDQFLLERQKQHEKERLNLVIQEKQRQIKRIQQQNQQLRARRHETDHQGHEFDILKKLSPTSVYFLLLLIMAIVAMS